MKPEMTSPTESAFEQLNAYLDIDADNMYSVKGIELQIKALEELETKIIGAMILSCKDSFQAKIGNPEIITDIFSQSLKLVRMINHQHAMLCFIASAEELIDDPEKKSKLESFASQKFREILEHDKAFAKLMRSVIFTLHH